MLSYNIVVLAMFTNVSMREPGGDTAQSSKLLGHETNVRYYWAIDYAKEYGQVCFGLLELGRTPAKSDFEVHMKLNQFFNVLKVQHFYDTIPKFEPCLKK